MPEEPQTPQEPVAEPTAQTPQEPVRYVKEDGGWNTEAFKDDLGKHSILEKYNSPEALVKAAINKDEIIGRKIDELVASDDPIIQEGLELRKGVPRDAREYEIVLPEGYDDLPEERRLGLEEYLKEASDWALENKISKQDFEKFTAWDLENSVKLHNEKTAEASDALAQREEVLRKEWRNKYDNNMEKSEQMADFLEMPKVKEYMQKDPELRREFFDAALKLTEDDVLISARQQHTAATARDQLDDLTQRMVSYTGSTSDPEYRQLQKKMSQIQRQIPQDSADMIPVLDT